MAKRATADPAGRVDILAMRILERLVENSDNLLLRGIYGSHKRGINQLLKKNLGKIQFHMDGYGKVKIGGGRVR